MTNTLLRFVAVVALAVASPAAARPALDCPLRDSPFTIDAPLIDVLLSPAARSVVDRAVPGLTTRLPPRFLNTTPPSFSSILSVRTLAEMTRMPPQNFDALDRDLRATPVSGADKAARCARYDADPVQLVAPHGSVRMLVFEKMTGFRDGPSVDAARSALAEIAQRKGWAMTVTDKGGAITPANVRRFDVIVWNNVSGDVLTLTQRKVMRHYIETGGGFVGLHGSGGDPTYFWDWYADALIGARFRGHPMGPQFQDARVRIDDPADAITRGLPLEWTMNDEWYSFKASPRGSGAHVLATLDEASYKPVEMGLDIRMGADHPIAWTRCVGDGRSFYSAIGHRPEVYTQPNMERLIEQGIAWAAGAGATRCSAGQEVAIDSARQ